VPGELSQEARRSPATLELDVGHVEGLLISQNYTALREAEQYANSIRAARPLRPTAS